MSRDIADAFEELYALDPALQRNSSGASDEQVTRAESELGVTFPPSYREFLRKHGGYTLRGGFEIAGISPLEEDDAMYAADVIRLTRFERENDQIPAYFVVLLNEDYERLFFLDTSRRNSSDECPVVVSMRGDPDVVDFFAENFVEFLLRVIKSDQ